MLSVQSQVNFLIAENPHCTVSDLYKSINAVTDSEKAAIRQAKGRALKKHSNKIYHPKPKKTVDFKPVNFNDVVVNGYPIYKSLYNWQWDLFEVVENNDISLVVVPRDHGKSIFFTFYIEYLLDVKKMDVLLLGWTDRVKQMAMYVFSYFLRHGKISEEQITRNTTNHFITNDGLRFDCYGLRDKAILGFHPEEYEGKNGMALIIDDPMDESFEFYPSKERDLEARWESTISNINPTKLVISGTRKFEGDFLEYVADTFGDKMFVYHKTPYNSDGTLLCPERWTIEKLKQKRAEIGEYRFSSEYLGDPQPITGGVWVETDLHYNSDIKQWSSFDLCMISVDAAWTTFEESDFTSIEVVFREKNTRKYITFVDVTEKMDFDSILDRIESLYHDIKQKYGGMNIKIAIENNGAGVILIKLARSRNYDFAPYIIEVHHNRAKQERIMVLDAPIKNGTLSFLDGLKKSALINQILTYPRCKNDDAIDAVAMAFVEMEQIASREFKIYRSKWH